MYNREHSSDMMIFAARNVRESNYWAKKLSGELIKTSFPRHGSRKDLNRRSLAELEFSFPHDLSSRLLKIINGSDYRLHMIFVAAVTVLLGKYSGNSDIIIGSPVYRQETDGKFVNTVLVLRNQIPDNSTFKDLLIQVKDTVAEAAKNQNYPIETILYQLGMTFTGDDFPLFDVVVLLENIHERLYIDHVKPNIVFSFMRTGDMEQGSIKGRIEYNDSFYLESFIQGIVGHLTRLLQEVLFDITISPDLVEILPDHEKKQILFDFNRTAAPYPSDKTIPDRFGEEVEKHPDHIAFVGPQPGSEQCCTVSVSFRELNQTSNRLARYLRKKGVGPNAITGIMAGRSLEMLVGIMAILKAGVAYMPLDPDNPGQRTFYMLEDCQSSVLLTTWPIMENISFTGLQGPEANNLQPAVTAPRPPINNLDQLPIPDRSLIDYEKYSKHISLAMVKNCISIQGTRGCPYDCAYCAKLWSKKHVFRSAEHIFQEVRHYYDMGIRRFSFIDDIFNLDIKNSSRFFELVISKGLDIQILFPAGLRGDIMTREYIDLMVKAGTINISVALETASPRVQKLIRKNLHIPKLKENLEYICEKHPGVILDLFTMHGLPTETEEEALMTLEFIKSLKWLHFPLINILKIYPGTGMEKLALDSGITRESILESENAAWHEHSETLPFNKNFTMKYQADFLNDYFLLKERLLKVLPHQMNVLTEDEIVQKYNSYLPVDIKCFDELLEFTGISKGELGGTGCVEEERFAVPELETKIRQSFPGKEAAPGALRILLLDLSQSFKADTRLLDDLSEPPLGLMYLLTWLNQRFGSKINGKIAKSGIDFDNYLQLKKLLTDFKPDIIGIRTLTFYKDFFHKTVSLLRHWSGKAAIIAGGPYATNGYMNLLRDGNVDLVVLSEGEITFAELVEKILENNGKLPEQEVIEKIPGIAFVPKKSSIKPGFAREILLLDQLPHLLSSESVENPDVHSQPGDPAYVIYTSGSTGNPRGVAIAHRSVNNLVTGLDERVYKQYGTNLNLGLLAPYIFDASVKQIFAALLLGHKLYPIPEDTRLDGIRLPEFLRREAIDICDGTPAYIHLLVESLGDAGIAGSLKHLLIGGEELSARMVGRFFHACQPHRPRITNVYGPTECCVDSTAFEVTPENIPQLETIPIGTPMPNVRVYILDRNLRLQPLTAVGELCIGGSGLGRGYVNNPELTAQKFVRVNINRKENKKVPGNKTDSPMSAVSALSDIYWTGDLARWLPDGNIEFSGRKDHQVKIRGYRIQLEEIENRLLAMPRIKEAAVITLMKNNRDNRDQDNRGRGTAVEDRYICAYIVSDQAVDIPQLKTYLSRHMPQYMVPWKFVQLDRIPLTVNGKVNKSALPMPVPGEGEGVVPPANPIQEKLVEIWSDVLAVEKERIGIDTDFFDLGGHSLKAVILTAKIHKELQVKIPLREIFEKPVIRGLSEYISEYLSDSGSETGDGKFIPIDAVEEKEYYPLSSAQKRLFILYRMEPASILYNTPYTLILAGRLSLENVRGVFKNLIRRHESFRTSFEFSHGESIQRVHREFDFDVEYKEARSPEKIPDSSPAPPALENIIRDFIRPFDLSRVPLLRVGLVKVEELKHILMIDTHHITSDGYSMVTFVTEFTALFSGVRLPLPRFRYRDFSRWQNSQKGSDFINKQKDYWIKQFEDEAPVLELPYDFPRPVRKDFEGKRARFEIDPAQTKAVKALAKKEDATLYMMLIALYTIFLSRLGGQEDIVIGAPLAGRRHSDLEHIVGMFINMLPLRNFPTADKSPGEFLREVRQRTLEAFENQDYPFEELVENLSLRRDIARSPLFDTVLMLLNIDIPEIEMQGLKLRPYANEMKTSKFDLIFHVHEVDGKLIFDVEYAAKLFKEETIARFIQYFKTIVTRVLADPDKKIPGIDIVSPEEKTRLLFEFNDTRVEYPRVKSLHRLFEEQTGKTPHRTAVIFHDKQLTYRQLNINANRLAGVLRGKGVKQDTLCAIMVRRSPEMITGIMGILKAGGAYLPIDEGTPPDRVISMADDCNAAVLLTNVQNSGNFSTRNRQKFQEMNISPVWTTKRKQVRDFDSLPFPNRSLVNYEAYNQHIGQAMVKNCISLQATRGCPYKCLYCHKIWPRTHVVRSAENIFAEVLMYYRLGVRRFAFVDDIFNLNIKNSRRFFQLIIDNGLDVQFFFPNGMRGDILTEDYIDLMVKAGLTNVAIALETASPRLQTLVEKNLDLQKLKETLDYFCIKHPQVITELFTMHGFPTETEEEAMMTLEFIKSLKWIHFPYVHVLKIYPNSDMEKLALKSGISAEAINRSIDLAWHEVPETLPFHKNFTARYQTGFLNDYFLVKERLLHLLPYQMKALTRDEIVKKYDTYLSTDINNFSALLKFVGITGDELTVKEALNEDCMHVPDLNRKISHCFPARKTSEHSLKILFLDLSQYFSNEKSTMLYNVVDPPLGLMYLLTYLDRQQGSKIKGKIAKSRIDFDNYSRLKQLIDEFDPDVIGVRSLTFFKDFFHQTISLIKQWKPDVPVIAGGPYATSSTAAILNDSNIDLVVPGEGEVTFNEIITAIIENNGRLPEEEVLRKIPGIVFIPQKEKPAAGGTREIIMLNEFAGRFPTESQDRENPVHINHPHDLAYVIYTSGSTGKPKGIAIQHASVLNLVFSQTQEFEIDETDRILQFSSVSFDASVEQIFMALSSGAALVLIDKMTLLDKKGFERFILNHSITHIHAVPSFLESITVKEFHGLKRVIAGGDRCPMHLARSWSKHCDFYNEYGPTETTVTAIQLLIRKGHDPEFRLPIGKPLANTSVYIFDRGMKLAPYGVTGALYLGGAGLARGYVNNPGLTGERFIANPFIKGERVYCTGDLARWLPDGNVEFLGRTDTQVKIRGFRVELAEIEKTIMKYERYSDSNISREENLYTISKRKTIDRCTRCLLPSDYPGIIFDETGICNLCNEFDGYRVQAAKYFKGLDDFHRLLAEARKTKQSPYDCLLLYSGGKDSSYVLYRLQEMNLKVLAFTFDNGYISGKAFENIKRTTAALNVDSMVCTAENMKEIFLESLKGDHTVCTGCFKGLTTISTRIAHEKGINMVITGLSRGQIFDTKLHGLFQQDIFAVEEIEKKLLLFRKMYHSVDDRMSELLNTNLGEDIFEGIHFVDFFRYDQAARREIETYLKEKDPYWSKPEDTGFCSSNCIVNDVGTYIHLIHRGYHNYAAPLSWDCRLGHIQREDGLEDISFEVDFPRVTGILREIGYVSDSGPGLAIPPIRKAVVLEREEKNKEKYLCAYFVSHIDIKPARIKDFLSRKLPSYMIPSHFIQVETIPLTSNGKVDRKALPEVQTSADRDRNYTAPKPGKELMIARVWQEVLELEQVGINDNFFDVGGNSSKIIQLAFELQKRLGRDNLVAEIFRYPTVASFVRHLEAKEEKPVRQSNRQEQVKSRLGQRRNRAR